MCIPFNTAKKTVDSYLAKGKAFTYDEIADEIVKEGGVLRIAPGFTVREYLESFVESNLLYFDPYTQTYGFISEIEEKKRELIGEIPELCHFT